MKIPETFINNNEIDFPTLGITKKGNDISVNKLGIGTSDVKSNLDIKGDNNGFNPKIYLNSTAYELIVETELINQNKTDTYKAVTDITFNSNHNDEQKKEICELNNQSGPRRNDNR